MPDLAAIDMRSEDVASGTWISPTLAAAVRVRMEKGEDPEQIEREMGDLLEGDDFSFETMKKKVMSRTGKPTFDEKLYDLHPE